MLYVHLDYVDYQLINSLIHYALVQAHTHFGVRHFLRIGIQQCMQWVLLSHLRKLTPAHKLRTFAGGLC